jgi:CRP-like cAMP-binding protein
VGLRASNGLPSELARGVFEKAPTVSLGVDQTVFLAGDPGDGCYRLEDGKQAVGAGERILAIHGS